MARHVVATILSAIHKLDNQSWDLLKPHAHKIICFHVEGFTPLYVEIKEEGLVTRDVSTYADTFFFGCLSSFLFRKGLEIKGDLELARALQETFNYIDIDLENHLSKVIPDPLSHGIAEGFKQTKAWVEDLLKARSVDLGAYFQDEIELLAPPYHIEKLYEEIDRIRHDVDRMQARLHLLKQNKEKSCAD